MIIAQKNYPCIGHIRVRPLGRRYSLTIYPPPGPGALMGSEPATFVEVDVGDCELRRIENQAPHLFLGARRRGRVKT